MKNVGLPLSMAIFLAVSCIQAPFAPESVAPPRVLLITTDALTYDPADPIHVTLYNTSASIVQMNLCPWELDRWTGTLWEVFAIPLTSCTADLHALQPSDSARTTIQLVGDFPDGSYRFRFEQLLNEHGVQLPVTERVTNDFRFD